MNIITLDFETYYDSDYTLKKLTVEEYVRDPRFEVLGVGFRGEAVSDRGDYEFIEHFFTGGQIKLLFSRVDWSNTACLCHHSQFDGLILSHHYGIRPYAWLDTLSMARLLIGNHISNALDSVAKHFGFEGKKINYDAFKGKHWNDLEPDVQKELAAGCLWDVELTYRIFCRFMSGDY